MYWVAMKGDGKQFFEKIMNLLMLIVMGMGLSLNNTRAVAEALIGKQSSFLRTPKFNINGGNISHHSSDYLLPIDPNAWIELLIAIYAMGLFGYVLIQGV